MTVSLWGNLRTSGRRVFFYGAMMTVRELIERLQAMPDDWLKPGLIGNLDWQGERVRVNPGDTPGDVIAKLAKFPPDALVTV